MINNRFGNKIIYQVELRTFTPEGTLNAAAELLPHIKETGFDIVYLCPVFRSDDHPDSNFWSARQNKSGSGNPKNSYRICDYFNVDEEYGTNDDLKAFIEKAHSLGLYVLCDLVYFHCGPQSVFLKDHPDFVKRDANGKITVGDWKFPMINFESKELREYLWSNMEYLVREFHVNGFRCDVGQLIPDDFWLEGVRRIKLIDPDVIMLNEGYVVDLTAGEKEPYAFDTNYNFFWAEKLGAAITGGCDAEDLRAKWLEDVEYYRGLLGKTVRNIDSHDIATDNPFGGRFDAICKDGAVECGLLVNHLLDGIPFIFNGYEVASSCDACMFANRFSLGTNAIDWQNALTEKGRKRLAFFKKVNAIRHERRAIWDGDVTLLESDCKKEIFAFERKFGDDVVTVIANVSDKAVEAKIDAKASKTVLMQNKCDSVTTASDGVSVKLGSYGYVVL